MGLDNTAAYGGAQDHGGERTQDAGERGSGNRACVGFRRSHAHSELHRAEHSLPVRHCAVLYVAAHLLYYPRAMDDKSEVQQSHVTYPRS